MMESAVVYHPRGLVQLLAAEAQAIPLEATRTRCNITSIDSAAQSTLPSDRLQVAVELFLLCCQQSSEPPNISMAIETGGRKILAEGASMWQADAPKLSSDKEPRACGRTNGTRRISKQGFLRNVRDDCTIATLAKVTVAQFDTPPAAAQTGNPLL